MTGRWLFARRTWQVPVAYIRLRSQSWSEARRAIAEDAGTSARVLVADKRVHAHQGGRNWT
jgi:hypothetical protein